MANPKSEALAFRIWAYASPLGWDCTINDIAEELDEKVRRVGRICQNKGWLSRLRREYSADDYFALLSGNVSQKRRFSSYADALKYSEHLL